MRLIDADALKRKSQKVATEAWKLRIKATVEVILNQFIDYIDAAPTIEPEHKTGKWIYHSDWEADGECTYECSECGMGSDVDYNYCMRCGADMREEQDAIN